MKWSRTLLASLVLMVCSAVAFAGGVVNINTANKETLENELKGIGPAKAAAIIKHRKEFGPFKSVDDLAKVSGIGEKTLAKIRKQLTVGTKTAKPK